MESEILRLLAGLDIGKASFLLLAVIVLWGMRNIVTSLLRIERHMEKMAGHSEQTHYFMNEMLAIFEREGLPFRKPKKEARKI
ncbi:MAG TPA: hypothetical protein ENK37_09400 [Oceanithermus profundus]|uniref:Uncharacterized protein n=1 Tax=Oceanithermus profundus TaxID=187137 RepID=A0A7C4VDF0_9DEIN|nr:hypothetical protein [Oceanithermus profundus]